MTTLLIVFFLAFKNLNAESFYMSEIFAESKSPWLELTNTSDKQIYIEDISVEIKVEEKISYFGQKTLKQAVVFSDRLIIAQEPDLGLGECLSPHLPVIILSDLHIARGKKITLCISINKQKSQCSTLSAKNRFHEGTSLYRAQEENIWLNEPCLLKPFVFATPGLIERACAHDNNFAADIFDCQISFKTAIVEFKPEEAFTPIIQSLTLEQSPPHALIEFEDKDLSDLWLMRLCAAPLESNTICYELNEPQSARAGEKNKILIPDHAFGFPTLLKAQIRDLYGLNNFYVINKSTENNIDEINLDIKNNNNNFELLLTLSSTQIPLSCTIFEENSDVIAQRAFVSAGRHRIRFATKDPRIVIEIIHKIHKKDIIKDLPSL
jgi:hypothetical protein